MKTRNMIYGFALALTCGLAATLKAQNIYVANYGNDTIGEYTTSGATVNASLVTGLVSPMGIAISPVPEPSSGALAGLGAAALWLRRRRK